MGAPLGGLAAEVQAVTGQTVELAFVDQGTPGGTRQEETGEEPTTLVTPRAGVAPARLERAAMRLLPHRRGRRERKALDG
jgi:hypothetical protein